MLCINLGYSQIKEAAIIGKVANDAIRNLNNVQEEMIRKTLEEASKVSTPFEQTYYNTRIDTASALKMTELEKRALDFIASENKRHQAIREKFRTGWMPRRIGPKQNYNINKEDPDYATSYTILRLMDDFGSRSKMLTYGWVNARMGEIIKEDEVCLCNEANRTAMRFVKKEKDYTIVLIPANTKGLQPIMFVAHTDNGNIDKGTSYFSGLPIHYNYNGGSINIGNDSIVVTPLEKNAENQTGQPFTDVEAKTIITTNGKTPIGLDAAASSTLLVSLCARLAFDDNIRHGDIYFYITQSKNDLRTAQNLRNLYNTMGPNNNGIMVLLDDSNSQSYGMTDNIPQNIKDIVDESHRTNGRIATLRALETTEKTEENYPPTISIYCGIKDPGTLGEWACLEYMKQSLQIAQSIVSMLGQK